MSKLQKELNLVERRLANSSTRGDQIAELRARKDALVSMETALIVSAGQNEIEEMRAKGLDIVPHRQRMNNE